jgi:anti-sigma factor RsiW
MTQHLIAEDVERYADGEISPEALPEIDAHLRDCSRCANAVMGVMQMKRAIRAAMPRFTQRRPLALRKRVSRPLVWFAAAAALVAFAIGGELLVLSRNTSARELVDLHTTILASANPIDVISTDRHTVKPWFEGRVPFAVNVPDLSATPFRLAGGRVVFWHGRPGAYLLVSKGAHRISLFVFESLPSLGSTPQMTIDEWRANGLTYVAVGDVSHEVLEALRRAYASENQ